MRMWGRCRAFWLVQSHLAIQNRRQPSSIYEVAWWGSAEDRFSGFLALLNCPGFNQLQRS